MSSITTRSTRELLETTDIVALWRALGGGKLRNNRGQAHWRGGDGHNVALYPKSNTWKDYAHGGGGGILRLIEVARGCSHEEAIRWFREDFHNEPVPTPSGGFKSKLQARRKRVEAELQADFARFEISRLRHERDDCLEIARECDRVSADLGRDDLEQVRYRGHQAAFDALDAERRMATLRVMS